MAEDFHNSGFSHFDAEGRARMVNVGAKEPSLRCAKASAVITMKASTLKAIRESQIAKGSVLGVARIAGIQGAKKTADLIPLCHPLALSSAEVDFEFLNDEQILVKSAVEIIDRTGVEMEALTACSVAALTIYDMCKAKDRSMTISALQLDFKSGGRSGDYQRESSRES